MTKGSDIPIITSNNPIPDKPALDPVELNQATNSGIVEVITGDNVIVTAGKTKGLILNPRQAMLCKFISEGLPAGKAYALAYNVKYEGNEDRCCGNASRLLAGNNKVKLSNEIARLSKIRCDSIVKNAPEKYAELFPESIDTLRDLLKPDQKGSVRLGAVREVKDVVIPKVSRHMSVKINVPADEYKRRRAIADKYQDA